jgi:hypothetical protein
VLEVPAMEADDAARAAKERWHRRLTDEYWPDEQALERQRAAKAEERRVLEERRRSAPPLRTASDTGSVAVELEYAKYAWDDLDWHERKHQAFALIARESGNPYWPHVEGRWGLVGELVTGKPWALRKVLCIIHGFDPEDLESARWALDEPAREAQSPPPDNEIAKLQAEREATHGCSMLPTDEAGARPAPSEGKADQPDASIARDTRWQGLTPEDFRVMYPVKYWELRDGSKRRPTQPDVAAALAISVSTLQRMCTAEALTWPPSRPGPTADGTP